MPRAHNKTTSREYLSSDIDTLPYLRHVHAVKKPRRRSRVPVTLANPKLIMHPNENSGSRYIKRASEGADETPPGSAPEMSCNGRENRGGKHINGQPQNNASRLCSATANDAKTKASGLDSDAKTTNPHALKQNVEHSAYKIVNSPTPRKNYGASYFHSLNQELTKPHDYPSRKAPGCPSPHSRSAGPRYLLIVRVAIDAAAITQDAFASAP